jgi:hypothetical protein
LDNAALCIEKNGAKQQNFLHGIGVSQNSDPIPYIERMFDKEEDYTGQYFLKAATDQPRQPLDKSLVSCSTSEREDGYSHTEKERAETRYKGCQLSLQRYSNYQRCNDHIKRH